MSTKKPIIGENSLPSLHVPIIVRLIIDEKGINKADDTR